MIDFIKVPREGCDYSEIEILTAEQFKEACAGPHYPCALGWAYEWREYDVGHRRVRAPIGLVFDYRVAEYGLSGWRPIGPIFS